MSKNKSSKSNKTDEQKRPIGSQTGEFKTTYGIYAYYDLKKSDWLYVGLDSHIDQNKRNRDHIAPSNYNKQPVNRTLQNDTEGRYVYNVIEINIKTYDDLRQSEKYYERLLRPKQNFAPCGGESPMRNPEVAKKSAEALTGENHPMFGKTGKDHNSFDPIIKIRKRKCSYCKQGFTWRTQPSINGKQKYISSTDLGKVIEKVVSFLCNDELNTAGYTGWEVVQ